MTTRQCRAASRTETLGADGSVRLRRDVIYGRKDGMALTLDVLAPGAPNGAGVLWIQSGGWYSGWQDPANIAPAAGPLLGKGITVFIVYHGSAPKYVVPEIVEDVRRSVRFVRSRAEEFGVDPERLGVHGTSAGGHLTLVLATTGDDGDPGAEDPVLRERSRVAAAVAFCPPTDIRQWVTDPPEVIRDAEALHPPLTFDSTRAGDYSPVMHVTAATPPTLLVHGDQDEIVAVSHSHNLHAELDKQQVPNRLVVLEGAMHGFDPGQSQIAVAAMVEWFDTHLVRRGTA